jgi:hypothetical protein
MGVAVFVLVVQQVRLPMDMGIVIVVFRELVVAEHVVLQDKLVLMESVQIFVLQIVQVNHVEVMDVEELVEHVKEVLLV